MHPHGVFGNVWKYLSIVMTKSCYWLLQVEAKDASQYPTMHSRVTSIRSTWLTLRNSGLGQEAVKEEKGLPACRTVAMADVQVRKTKQKFRVPGFTTENEVLNELGFIFPLVLQHSQVLRGSRSQVHVIGCRPK